MARDQAYREAEKKIEEARRSGAKKLDLSAHQWETLIPQQLTELPESLRQLTQLQLPGCIRSSKGNTDARGFILSAMF